MTVTLGAVCIRHEKEGGNGYSRPTLPTREFVGIPMDQVC